MMKKVLDSILSSSSTDSLVFHQTVDFLAKVYSNPNSVLRNEIYYDIILKAQMESKWYSISDKQNIDRKFDLLHQNDIGNLANDFEYRMLKGQRKTMHGTVAGHLLLYFYNPECDACKQMAFALKNSALVTKAINQGKLKILCVYTDSNLSIWNHHLHEYPSQWIQGRDENEYVYKNGIYDLKAIPTFYLLDRNKKVILKDCTSIEELERNL